MRGERKGRKRTNDLKSKIAAEEACRPQRLMKGQITERSLIKQKAQAGIPTEPLVFLQAILQIHGNKLWFLGHSPVRMKNEV